MIPSLKEILSDLEELIEFTFYNGYTGLLTIKTKDKIIFVVDPANPSDDFLRYYLNRSSNS